MTDPLRDDRFPDRPHHPDFWRLSNVVTKHDGRAGEGQVPIPDIISEYMDPASLLYLCSQRAQIVLQRMGGELSGYEMLMGAILDGVLIGAGFAAEGGRREQ